MSTLNTSITALANTFAEGVLRAIRSASLEDILAESGRGGGARAARSAPAAGRAKGGSTGRGRKRLGRRSAGDIEATLESIVALLKKNPAGLRAEQIRAEMGLEKREMPKPIAEGLASKKLTKKGEKRATTYFAR